MLRNNTWVIWLTLVAALVLNVAPMPAFLEVGRPLWLMLIVAFWALMLPERLGMAGAWLFGLAQDVLSGTLLGQNGLVLVLVVCMVHALYRRLHMFPVWQQCLVLLVVFGLAQLVQLWLLALTGNPPPTLIFVLPALVSALLWPWVYLVLRLLQLRLNVR